MSIKIAGTLWKAVLIMVVVCGSGVDAGEYNGRYCAGKGDVEYLRMIDTSFSFLRPSADVPNISMLYWGDWNGLTEGAQWMMWWIQNSYGPSYCAMPFLKDPWRTALQNSQDFWFKHQGDGKTRDLFEQWKPKDIPDLEIPPEGCLVDAAQPSGAFHRQGDCTWWKHDWAYEFTAAGVVLQAELLLINRNPDAIKKYLPNLERACEFIEKRRDPKTNAFLVGPGANLLAPSYGGGKDFGKAYLAGMNVTYCAALDRMIELYKLIGYKDKQDLYAQRRQATHDGLQQFLTDKGYLVKSIELE